ncbi:hypothetical protein Q7C36_009945 [Tachysurus vachellii]|uniref:Uncharacterized protein n=1 Tax=Tachysurus vachellii TaxID=175792 RepID=A0AA88SRC9_TACVA|nr:hypothetical protein Q7C36_009945 [Tachysurus vachellii]
MEAGTRGVGGALLRSSRIVCVRASRGKFGVNERDRGRAVQLEGVKASGPEKEGYYSRLRFLHNVRELAAPALRDVR